jgi:hypothetical protein
MKLHALLFHRTAGGFLTAIAHRMARNHKRKEDGRDAKRQGKEDPFKTRFLKAAKPKIIKSRSEETPKSQGRLFG